MTNKESHRKHRRTEQILCVGIVVLLFLNIIAACGIWHLLSERKAENVRDSAEVTESNREGSSASKSNKGDGSTASNDTRTPDRSDSDSKDSDQSESDPGSVGRSNYDQKNLDQSESDMKNADEPKNSNQTNSDPTDSTQSQKKQDPAEDSQEAILEQQTDDLLGRLTLEEKIAQLFILAPEQLISSGESITAAGEQTREAINAMPVGGLLYFGPNLLGPEQTREMLANTQAYSMQRIGLPMFLCVDEEGGQVARIAGNGAFGVPGFSYMNEVGARNDPSEAKMIGQTIGGYLQDLGFNTDFAPVADVLTNPANTVVYNRSFGSDPNVVTAMTAAVQEGLNEKYILGCYKHFPGHGDTSADTHEGYAYSYKSKEELYQCELLPFINGIENKVPFIMVGHISFPSITGNDTPASLSPQLIQNLLIDELGYKGLVITDALNMGAISQQYSSADAAVLAIQAGVDMLLVPADFYSAYQGVLAAVQNGTISEERIDTSVRKIIRTKLEWNGTE